MLREHTTSPEPLVLPDDEHNRALVHNVHPPEWVNPSPATRYNLVVIGAGAGGLVSALGSAALGSKVALIEKSLLGGDCLNVGCVPSKALLRCARAMADVRDAGRFGVHVPSGARADFADVMRYVRRLRAQISPHDSVWRLRDAGVDVFLGEARFTGQDSVQVDGQTLRFTRAIIAAGGRPAAPPVPGLDQVGYLTNETVFSLTELPPRLAVIGAGPVGCELAQAFARLGSEVYLIEAMHGILPREDPHAAEMVRHVLLGEGIKLMCCGKNLKVDQREDGKHLIVDSHEAHYNITVDQILVGAGRTPNVEGLGLESAGVEFNKDGVKVNDRLQTTNRRIFAVGDICSPYKFTHVSDAHARLAVRNALFLGRGKHTDLTIPWVTYTDPEIAHVGLYVKDAADNGIELQTFDIAPDDVDRFLLDGEDHALLKVHVKKGSDKIVGATMVARHAGEMLGELTLAMTGGVGLRTISDTIHSYPTQAEAIRKAGDAYNRTRLTPRVRWMLGKWLAWQR